MLLKLLNYSFIFFSLGFILMTLCRKQVMNHLEDNMKKSDYVAIMTFFLGFYVISAILIGILVHRPLFFVFASCPFIVGYFANYNQEKIYTTVQILIMLYSVMAVFI